MVLTRKRLIALLFLTPVTLIVCWVVFLKFGNTNSRGLLIKNEGEYCSFANKCPSDKCYVYTNCAHGAGGFGCIAGNSECNYKDTLLKEKYYEITKMEALNCVNEFVNKNSNEYPGILDLSVDEKESGNETYPCLDRVGDASGDRWCWSIYMDKVNKPNFPFKQHIEVGGQTCNVYWELQDYFKSNYEELSEVKYSPEEAILCARNYIYQNQNKKPAFANFDDNKKLVVQGEPRTHPVIFRDHSKDWVAYTVIQEVTSGSPPIYLVVGAHSCTVYEAH